jgi:Icc protein
MSNQSESHLSRRGFLSGAGALAASMLFKSRALAAPAAREGFRFVHLTDIHVQPERRGADGFRACLDAVHKLNPRPDFILTGGDLVFDILKQDEARAKQLFDVYTSICKDSDIPIRQCIGNHDVFGWSSKGKIAPDHVSYGKKMVQERLDLPRTTYSFDHKGWHFVVVDDIQPREGGGYEGGISEEDMHWIDSDLTAAGKRPTVMCAHIPFMSVTVFRNVDVTTTAKDITISRASICRNVGPILSMLRKHEVDLVLTGHQHQSERIEWEKTTHIEDAAVCGAWWKGAHNGFAEGFGIIDVKADGTFEHRYHTYGWKAEESA